MSETFFCTTCQRWKRTLALATTRQLQGKKQTIHRCRACQDQLDARVSRAAKPVTA